MADLVGLPANIAALSSNCEYKGESETVYSGHMSVM